jgi:hypothetical protein
VLKNVEFDGLGKRSALADGNNITFRYIYKARGAVSCQLVVALFKSTQIGSKGRNSKIIDLLTYDTWRHTGGNLGER